MLRSSLIHFGPWVVLGKRLVYLFDVESVEQMFDFAEKYDLSVASYMEQY
jgi:hypothetical protein